MGVLGKGVQLILHIPKLVALISGHFAPNLRICGAVVSVRMREDIISLWNSASADYENNKLARYLDITWKRYGCLLILTLV